MRNNRIDIKENQVLVLAFIIVQIVFIVILILFSLGFNKNGIIDDSNDLPKITIDNLSSVISDLPEEYASNIRFILTDAVELNQSDLNDASTEAIIRNDSVVTHKFDEYGFYALSFIVDIPNLEQSYQLYYQYPINVDDDMEDSLVQQTPSAVLCLEEKSQIKYPDFQCRSNYSPDIRQRIISDYLNLIEFEQFTAFINVEDDPKKIQITPILASDDKTKGLYIQEVKDTVRSLGVSPDYFNYEVLAETDFNYYISE